MPQIYPGEGEFVDERGRFLGKHKGIIRYTVGQRKGLGLSLGRPAYVKRIEPETNESIIGAEAILFGDLHFMSVAGIADGEALRANVKVRYRHAGAAATLEQYDSDTVRVRFDSSVKAATLGQSAVFYDNQDHILGVGIIVKAY